jgi:hypothetical protein
MKHPSRIFWITSISILAIIGMMTGLTLSFSSLAIAQTAEQEAGTTPPYIKGPFYNEPVYPTVFHGDLRDLPQLPSEGGEVPAPGTAKQPFQGNPASSTLWVDTVAQHSPAQGQMPGPITNFEGLTKAEGGGWTPPDTNGDVGPNHYIQTVNIAMGIFNKAGQPLVKISYNDFFQGPPNSPCDNQNRGDVVVLYDANVDRWIVTDFSLPGPNYYECIAVSMTGDPVSGGWYFYELLANPPGQPFANAFNDYPKLGVWADGWYMSANMFTANFEGVRMWALDRAAMIVGGPLNEIHFDCVFSENSNCISLLPANIRGTYPPEGSPEYFASVTIPDTLNLWKFHSDWDSPDDSTFTGPFPINVAGFTYDPYSNVPQQGTSQQLDSLADRLMMQLQYRNLNGIESLYANHSVLSGGVYGIRWYEVRDPGGIPVLFQQGTYQPDQHYRWMGSIAADGEGNIAVGYSVSSSTMYPAIRYAGRLAGEIPNLLTQNEAVLYQGAGSQTGTERWGDYSAMTVDPTDDCTFWYTSEYATAGSNWRTRIGSFKFPSCGQPKGTIAGYVYNSVTNLPVAGVPVFATGASYNFSGMTDGSGYYSIDLIGGSYNLTAGPLLPGYPGTDIANDVIVVEGDTTEQHFYLNPVPSLVHDDTTVFDANGNNNGFPEPGEQGLQLFESLYNQGAITSTQVTAKITSLTAGVTVNTSDTTYADMAAGITETNSSPYIFSIDPTVPCGSDLNFQALVTDSVSTYNTTFSLNASVPLPRKDLFYNNVEGGQAGWTHGGTRDSWIITTEDAYSPTHSWTDSEGGNYQDNTNTWLRSPVYDMTGKRQAELSWMFKYALENGWDYLYVEYSLNGGSSWNLLASYTGEYEEWHQETVDASVLDDQPNIALRFRLQSDGNTNFNGVYLDNIALSYESFECNPVPDAPTLISPVNGSSVSNPVTFVWQPAEHGGQTDGYVFYLDNTPVITFTDPTTTVTLDVSLWRHSWYVKATNATGDSLPSETWIFDILGKFFLPITQK